MIVQSIPNSSSFSDLFPPDQVQISLDLGAQWSVGCHWGTLRQKALEHVAQPPKDLKTELDRRGINDGVFEVLQHGETRVIQTATVT